FRSHEGKQESEIEAGENRVRHGDRKSGRQSLPKRELMPVGFATFFDTHSKCDNRSEIENGNIRELRGRSFDVQDKKFQRHPRGDDERDGDAVFEGEFHNGTHASRVLFDHRLARWQRAYPESLTVKIG